jgi:hypothetical protein
MGKAKRFNSYDSDVEQQRKLVRSYGQARQNNSVSSFRSSPLSPPTATNTDNSSDSVNLTPLDNIWTGVNTFQSTVSLTGPTVNLGDSSGDRVNFISQVGTNIEMTNNKITGLATPTNSTDAATKAYVDSGGGGWVGTATSDLDMDDYDIENIDIVGFKVTGQRFNSTNSSIQYEVPSGDSHKFLVSSVSKVTIDSDGLNVLTGDLDMAYGTAINFNSSVATTRTGGAAASLPSNPVGYILIKFAGSFRYIPYYS